MIARSFNKRLQKLEARSGGPSLEVKLAAVSQFAFKRLPADFVALLKHATPYENKDVRTRLHCPSRGTRTMGGCLYRRAH